MKLNILESSVLFSCHTLHATFSVLASSRTFHLSNLHQLARTSIPQPAILRTRNPISTAYRAQSTMAGGDFKAKALDFCSFVNASPSRNAPIVLNLGIVD